MLFNQTHSVPQAWISRRRVVSAALALGAALAVPHVAAQSDWPSRPLTIVIPYSPGGVSDIIARSLSEKLSARLGQPVIVDSKPGANTLVAVKHLLRQPPDGYTVFLTTNVHALAPVLFPKEFTFDPIKDFTSLGIVGYSPLVLVVNSSVPAKSLPEFLALARAKPGEVTLGTVGLGNIDHLAAELIGYRAGGLKFNQIPYKGASDAINDMLGGRINGRLDAIPSVKQHLESGKLRALAVTGPRTELLPGIPAVQETIPGIDVTAYFHLLARSDIPAPVAERLAKEVQTVMAMPDLKARLLATGLEPTWGTPTQQIATMRKDVETWRELIKATGLKIE